MTGGKRRKAHINSQGYAEGDPKHSKRIARQVAFKEIYKKNRSKYPLRFGEYQVHHKDGKKLNNDPDNLQLVTPEEHARIHGRSVEEFSDKPAAKPFRMSQTELLPHEHTVGTAPDYNPHKKIVIRIGRKRIIISNFEWKNSLLAVIAIYLILTLIQPEASLITNYHETVEFGLPPIVATVLPILLFSFLMYNRVSSSTIKVTLWAVVILSAFISAEYGIRGVFMGVILSLIVSLGSLGILFALRFIPSKAQSLSLIILNIPLAISIIYKHIL